MLPYHYLLVLLLSSTGSNLKKTPVNVEIHVTKMHKQHTFIGIRFLRV
jgi:hypothetical protein